MFQTIFRSLKMTLVLAVVLCGLYPLAVFVVGRALFPNASTGGLIERNGKVVGAALIGQGFTKPEYFHGRPSAAGEKGYDAANSSGANLGPTSQKLIDRMKADVARLKRENPTLKDGEIPTGLVTASGSGLDPHISPRGAEVQIARVAAARKAGEADIKSLVERFTEGPQLGFLGEATVNVLLLNLELDKAHPMAR